MKIKKIHKKSFISLLIEYFLLIIGSIGAAFALECILIPNSILDGGVNGISIILNKIYHINLSLLVILINIPFVFIGYKNLGKRFVFKTLVSIVSFSIFLHIFENVPEITDNILLATVYGSALLGLGVGLIIRFGGCLDGTESLGLVISKQTNMSVGQFVLCCNIIIYSCAAFIYGVDRALFSLLAYFITSKIVDEITTGFEKAKAAMIITDNGEDIAKQIYMVIGRTCTKMRGKGLISGEKEVLYCVLTRIEISELKEIVYSCDQSAFITISDISEIIGQHIKSTKAKKRISFKKTR